MSLSLCLLLLLKLTFTAGKKDGFYKKPQHEGVLSGGASPAAPRAGDGRQRGRDKGKMKAAQNRKDRSSQKGPSVSAVHCDDQDSGSDGDVGSSRVGIKVSSLYAFAVMTLAVVDVGAW